MASSVSEYKFTEYRTDSAYKKELESIFNQQINTMYGDQATALKRIYDAVDRKCELLFRNKAFKGFVVYKTELQNRHVSKGVKKSIEIKNLVVFNKDDPDNRLYRRLMIHRVEKQTAKDNPEGMYMLVSAKDQDTESFLISHDFKEVASWKDVFIDGENARLLFKSLVNRQVGLSESAKKRPEVSAIAQELSAENKRGRTDIPLDIRDREDHRRRDFREDIRERFQSDFSRPAPHVPVFRQPAPQESKKHTIPLKKQYLDQINSGAKTVEGRIDLGMMKNVKVGDTVCFFAGANKVYCRIAEVNKYPSFEKMLEKEGVNNCLADITDLQAGVRLYHSIPTYREKAAQFGVLAWKLELMRGV